MHGWSASGQVLWWQGRQGTLRRRTKARRDQGRHCLGRFVPLNRMTDAVEAEAAMCAGPESEPMNRSARSRSAGGLGHGEPAGPVAEPGMGLDRPRRPRRRPARRPGSPASHRRGTGRSGLASAGSASAWPRPRPRGGPPASGAGSPNRPAWRASGSSQESGSLRPEDSPRPSALPGPRRRAARAGTRPDRPGQASRSFWATRARSRSVAWTRTRVATSSGSPRQSSRARRDSTSWRPGTHRATSVSRNPPPPIAQPSRRGMPASARTKTVRMSPRTSIPRS